MSKPTHLADMAHPKQPIGYAKDGCIRFKKNAIVDWLLQAYPGGYALNVIAEMVAHGEFAVEDLIQLDQLLGYSVSGFGDLSYVPRKFVEKCDKKADKVIRRFKRKKETSK